MILASLKSQVSTSSSARYPSQHRRPLEVGVHFFTLAFFYHPLTRYDSGSLAYFMTIHAFTLPVFLVAYSVYEDERRGEEEKLERL